MVNTNSLIDLLQEKFQLPAFRTGQEEVVQAILAGNDVLCIMPTGYGKSLCYQLPALVIDGITVVVSPLVALMKDQVDALQARSFAQVTFINSSIPISEQKLRLFAMKTGRFKLVYISPERFRSRAFLRTLSAMKIALFVVDEAHCISHWGHDFRPDYLVLKDAIAALGRPQVAAFTATATQEVRTDIKNQLGIDTAQEFLHSVGRSNLEFFVFPVASNRDKLLWVNHLVQTIGGKGIIYAGRRRDCEFIQAFLQFAGFRSEYFHAARKESEKKSIQERFMSDDHPQALDVIAATNAFGLGIDKPNIRFVIHSAIPGTVEEYFQEAGRAGRDGCRAFCILLYSYDDRTLQEWFIENSLVSREELIKIYQILAGFPGAGKYLIIDQEQLYWRLQMDETRIRVGLSHLERLGMIRRFPDIDTQVTLDLYADSGRVLSFGQNVADPAQAAANAQIIRALVTLAQKCQTLDLADFCARQQLDPVQVVQLLYDLEFEGILNFQRGRRALLVRIEKPIQDLVKMPESRLKVDVYRNHKLNKLDKILRYCESGDCRVRYIQHYFGETVSQDCGHCDNCRSHKTSRNLPTTAAIEKASKTETNAEFDYFDANRLSLAILLTVQGVHGHAGKNTVADILKGSQAKNVLNFSFDKLPTYGKLPYFRKEALVEAVKLQILKGLVLEERPVDFDYPVLKLAPAGLQMLNTLQDQCAAMDWPPEPLEMTEDAEPILASLKRFRIKTADAKKVAPYQILHDSTLEEIALMKPKNIDQLAFIRGFSQARLDQYGVEILRVLQSHYRADHAGLGRFSAEDLNLVRNFLRGHVSHALIGDFDAGYALDNHTEVKDGLRQYTPTGQMVYEFKYQGVFDHLEALVTKLAKIATETDEFQRLDLILAVPSTCAERKYDPVPCLAQSLGQTLACPYAPEVLVKTRATRPQKELVNLTQKQLNVKGAFRVTQPEKIRGKNVLVLDDLYDSGATLNECTQVLKAAGAGKILVLTLTRTVHT